MSDIILNGWFKMLLSVMYQKIHSYIHSFNIYWSVMMCQVYHQLLGICWWIKHTDKMELLRMTSKQAITISGKCYKIIGRTQEGHRTQFWNYRKVSQRMSAKLRAEVRDCRFLRSYLIKFHTWDGGLSAGKATYILYSISDCIVIFKNWG